MSVNEKTDIDYKRAKQVTESKRGTGKASISDRVWAQIRKDKNHKERLIRMARHNGGMIKVNETSSLLYTRGIVKSKRRSNVYQIVQGLLADMTDNGIFEKAAPGLYRLVGNN